MADKDIWVFDQEEEQKKEASSDVTAIEQENNETSSSVMEGEVSSLSDLEEESLLGEVEEPAFSEKPEEEKPSEFIVEEEDKAVESAPTPETSHEEIVSEVTVSPPSAQESTDRPNMERDLSKDTFYSRAEKKEAASALPENLEQNLNSQEEKSGNPAEVERRSGESLPLVLKRDRRKEQVPDDKENIEEEVVTEDHKDFYRKVLQTLEKSEDMGFSADVKDRIRKVASSDVLPQLAVRELVSKRVVGKIQLGRAVARTQKRLEIMSFLDVPQEAMGLRKELDPRVTAYLRDQRIIPIAFKTNQNNESQLHLASEISFRDLVKESAVREFIPNCNFVWHFALREVCGAYWLAGESDDVDVSMEAEALLDRVLGNAIDARSSDIHIDPSIKGEPRAIVKYRIDGFVTPKEVITLEQLDRLRVRIENIARMPKVNLNHPNKGAFTRAGYDWRVQVQPHAGRQGPVPRMVLRRLQPDVMPMESLGYPEYFIRDIKSAASAPNGVIFWTGPTGSGKTESIHSAVVSVNPMGKGLSLHTIEDPPEKRVSGYAVQMEIAEGDDARSGMQLLKSSLRADPDVIIFGEVRDEEMAGLVFEAANTGHLVFTTLHTNTSLDAIVRLDELGIYGFLISYIRGIAAQRLVRRLCTHCRIKADKVDDFTESIFDRYQVEMDGARLYKANPEGCASCNHTGYHGRIAICEWLKPNKELVDASARREYEGLEEIATRAGWKPMGYMGTLHIKNGITDADELSSKVLELATENL